MRKTVKRLLCATLAVGMVIGGAACKKTPVEEQPGTTTTPVVTDTPATDLQTIGICQYADHGALNRSREGLIKGLEEAGLVVRHEYLEVPVRVEYEITEACKSLIPILEDLSDWYEAFDAEQSKEDF